jgi:hypothetical protein
MNELRHLLSSSIGVLAIEEDVRDAASGRANRKRRLSDSRNAQSNQRLTPLQLELANASRIVVVPQAAQ